MDRTDVALGMRYDLRSAPFGCGSATIYHAALEQCAWADAHGFEMVGVSEHHGADDGYCPSPIVFASAMAVRTSAIRITLAALIVPLHDPLRLAEDLAVVDVLSNGRLDVIAGAGYRQAEFAMLDRDFEHRTAQLESTIEVLRTAWTGEPFDYEGRTVQVTPRPVRPGGPRILVAGTVPAAARRAARLGDGFVPVDPSLWPHYVEACRALGKEPDGAPMGAGPGFLHVTHDPERAWAQIAPHAFYETSSYATWLLGTPMPRYDPAEHLADLQASGGYAVVTPDEAIELARRHGELRLHPLMGGLDPDLAWSSLELVADEVLPALRTTADAASAQQVTA